MNLSGGAAGGSSGNENDEDAGALAGSGGGGAGRASEGDGAGAAVGNADEVLTRRRGGVRMGSPQGGADSSGGALSGDKKDLPEGPESGRATHPRPQRVKGMRISVAAAEAANDGQLRGLRRLLGLRSSSMLTVTKSLPFEATLSWGSRGRRQWVRASDDLYRAEWSDHLVYRTGDGTTVSHGRAALAIKAIEV